MRMKFKTLIWMKFERRNLIKFLEQKSSKSDELFDEEFNLSTRSWFKLVRFIASIFFVAYNKRSLIAFKSDVFYRYWAHLFFSRWTSRFHLSRYQNNQLNIICILQPTWAFFFIIYSIDEKCSDTRIFLNNINFGALYLKYLKLKSQTLSNRTAKKVIKNE
jgi:hypothetical protein